MTSDVSLTGGRAGGQQSSQWSWCQPGCHPPRLAAFLGLVLRHYWGLETSLELNAYGSGHARRLIGLFSSPFLPPLATCQGRIQTAWPVIWKVKESKPQGRKGHAGREVPAQFCPLLVTQGFLAWWPSVPGVTFLLCYVCLAAYHTTSIMSLLLTQS